MKKQQPFFAKFLESQLAEETLNNVKGGDCLPNTTTRKAPSDWEDDMGITTRIDDIPDSMTLKYPSDIEEGV